MGSGVVLGWQARSRLVRFATAARALFEATIVQTWAPVSAIVHVLFLGSVMGSVWKFTTHMDPADQPPGASATSFEEPDAEAFNLMLADPAAVPTTTGALDPQPPPPMASGDELVQALEEKGSKLRPPKTDGKGVDSKTPSIPPANQNVKNDVVLGLLPGSIVSASVNVSVAENIKPTDDSLMDIIDGTRAVASLFAGSHLSMADCELAAVAAWSDSDDDIVVLCQPSEANFARFHDSVGDENDFTRSTRPSAPRQEWANRQGFDYAIWPFGNLGDRVIVAVADKYVVIGRIVSLAKLMQDVKTLPNRLSRTLVLKPSGWAGSEPFLTIRMVRAAVLPSNSDCGAARIVLSRPADRSDESRIDADWSYADKARADEGAKRIADDEQVRALDFGTLQTKEGVVQGTAHLKDSSMIWAVVMRTIDGDKPKHLLSRAIAERRLSADAELPTWGAPIAATAPSLDDK